MKKLPTIKIISIKDVKSNEVKFETDDTTMKMIEDFGRKSASSEDFIRIGFIKMLEDTIEHQKKNLKGKRK